MQQKGRPQSCGRPSVSRVPGERRRVLSVRAQVAADALAFLPPGLAAGRKEGRAPHCTPDNTCPACAGLLQVRLEIAVVANFLVDLEPIPLAIGDDDRVAVRIEFDRGREAKPPLRLFTRRRAFIMSGLASMLCWPHFDSTWASPTSVVIGPPSESNTQTRWLPQSLT